MQRDRLELTLIGLEAPRSPRRWHGPVQPLRVVNHLGDRTRRA